jgi:hypothetical protein
VAEREPRSPLRILADAYLDQARAEDFHWEDRMLRALDLACKRIAELEAENAALAADQCHKGYGDDRGNHRCSYQDRIVELQAESKQLRERLEFFEDDEYRPTGVESIQERYREASDE